MAVDEWLDLMPDSVVVTPYTSQDQYGAAVFSTAGSTYRARWVRTQSEVRDANGNTVIGNHSVWIASTGEIGAKDRITLPDGSTPQMLQAERRSDQTGTHHWKLTLQ